MTTIVCDVTKKAIPDAERGVNYVTILDKTLSMNAYEEFEKKVSDKMKKDKEYTLDNYKKVYRETLKQVCK